MPAIVLHEWVISPFCGKVRRILDHKQLAYETVTYNGLRARKAAGLSPVGKLPVLDYEGERIQDSSDIAAFLDAKHPSPALFPADPLLRAQAHVWEDWADEALYWFEVYFRFAIPDALKASVALLAEGRPAYERKLVGVAIKRMYRGKLAAQGLGRLTRERVEEKLVAHLDALETVLAGQRWLVGGERTIADIAVASQLAEIVRTSHMAGEIKRRSRIDEWLARA